ncbi:MAG: ABC transporter substrate-binding protein [Clostridiales bacterium]|nr:ABC transporter substrate-binding protein [Clostridiales bacterium]
MRKKSLICLLLPSRGTSALKGHFRCAPCGALPLLVAVLLLVCCSCGGETKEATGSSSASDEQEVVTLRFPLIVDDALPENIDQVEDTLNDYLNEQIGVQVSFVAVSISSLEDYYLLQSSSTEKLDFFSLLPGEELLSTMVDAGLILPLDDLLTEYGQGVLDSADEVLSTGQLNGVQYMVPAVRDNYTMGTSLEFNAALVRKYGFDISSIETLADVEPMLEVILENEPGVVPFTSSGSASLTQLLGGYDCLGDTLGVLNLRADDSLTVVDWYETEEFLELTRFLYQWNQKGYLSQDAVVSQQSGTSMVEEGTAFCTLSTIMPTGDYGSEVSESSVVVEVQLSDQPQLLTSYQMGLEGICISASCAAPEKAMQLLNLLYTDECVVNLLEHGIEDVNYTLTEDGAADHGGGYFLLYGQPLNQTLRYPSADYGEHYEEKCLTFAENDVVSPACGFVFDSSPVSKEVALCQAVVEYYFPVLDCGCVDPDEEIPKFVEELKEAGIDTIIAEKQRQLDQWAAEQTDGA